ncbi:MAG TPA: restriction endonuclease, partial [Beijerinckiaceae bacterium]|nr:restriction endonuclease [Beijerinckiaceae bacterium]
EAEIARRLADIENLRRDPALAGFVAWVRTKPDDFHARTRLTRDRRQRCRSVRW